MVILKQYFTTRTMLPRQTISLGRDFSDVNLDLPLYVKFNTSTSKHNICCIQQLKEGKKNQKLFYQLKLKQVTLQARFFVYHPVSIQRNQENINLMYNFLRFKNELAAKYYNTTTFPKNTILFQHEQLQAIACSMDDSALWATQAMALPTMFFSSVYENYRQIHSMNNKMLGFANKTCKFFKLYLSLQSIYRNMYQCSKWQHYL
eukprot:TRINITY_DN2327_c0_g2_i3.p1 TRINITY_DN2327_c0_g2~~TRINITY_DN2327_c0_g2_i3.p1  ORF type:complete len:204 (-),score=4.68 TRINITY_DN2327_c0_g2_i3:414-1025(-)